MSQVGSSFTGEAKLGNPLAEISHIKMSGVERFPRLHKFWHVDGVFHDSLHAEDFVCVGDMLINVFPGAFYWWRHSRQMFYQWQLLSACARPRHIFIWSNAPFIRTQALKTSILPPLWKWTMLEKWYQKNQIPRTSDPREFYFSQVLFLDSIHFHSGALVPMPHVDTPRWFFTC